MKCPDSRYSRVHVFHGFPHVEHNKHHTTSENKTSYYSKCQFIKKFITNISIFHPVERLTDRQRDRRTGWRMNGPTDKPIHRRNLVKSFLFIFILLNSTQLAIYLFIFRFGKHQRKNEMQKIIIHIMFTHQWNCFPLYIWFSFLSFWILACKRWFHSSFLRLSVFDVVFIIKYDWKFSQFFHYSK